MILKCSLFFLFYKLDMILLTTYTFFLQFILFIYLCLAALGLCC